MQKPTFPFRSRVLSVLFVLGATVTCAGVMTHQVGGGDASDGPLVAAAGVVAAPPARLLPPVVDPPPLANEVWLMPDVEQRRPRFGFLPGEDPTVSRSVGNVSEGHLVNAARLPLPHQHMAVLPVQFQRNLIYATDQMVALVEEAAAFVDAAFPGSVLYLGNFSAPGGGDIPYSVSHNSGRDADAAFYHLDAEGNPAVVPNLLPLDDNGEFIGEEGSEYEGHYYRFDVARNWKFVEGLVRSEAATLQYIFISNPLRRMLLDEARRVGAPRDVIARAEALLVQPGGALPHNDHFHLRIHCSADDVRAGCKDGGRPGPDYTGHGAARAATIQTARKLLSSPEPRVRLAAVQRLALLDARATAREIERRLGDDAPQVRAGAAHALAELGRGGGALAARLATEDHPQVLVELVDALGRLGGRVASDALTAFLEAPRRVELPGLSDIDARTIAADALVRLEDARPVPALIGALADDDPQVRTQAARALRILTNHTFGGDWHTADPDARTEAIARWQQWYDAHRRMSRDQWLALGFQQAGLPVERLDARFVWELCRAITADDHLSHNAQRILMRIAGREAASLSWSKEDASFYWRRWFERRADQFRVPAIPQELSTL